VLTIVGIYSYSDQLIRPGGDLGGEEALAAEHRLLTVNEVANAMRVSTMTIYRLIKSGDLVAIRVGHRFRIREADLDQYFVTQTFDPVDASTERPTVGDPWPAV
jgi:excisionase family DNA binding protein